MTLAVVIVVLWESIVSALGPGVPLPDPALAFAVALGLRRREEGGIAAPLALGGLSGLFTAAPWAVRPLECLAAAAISSWLARSMGPSGLLGEVLVVLCAMAGAAVVEAVALALGPGGGDTVGIAISAALSAPLALVFGAILPSGRRRYGA